MLPSCVLTAAMDHWWIALNKTHLVCCYIQSLNVTSIIALCYGKCEKRPGEPDKPMWR